MSPLRQIALISAAMPVLAGTGSAYAGELEVVEKALRPVFQQHCTKCHGDEDKVKGKVNLVEMTMPDFLADPDHIEDMIAVLECEESQR